MKKILILTFAICLSAISLAQPMEQQEGNKISRYEQIQSAKIAFFTTELELTPREAAAFWPVYNQYWDEREAAHKRIQRSLKAVCMILNSNRPNAEESLRKMLDNYVGSYAAEGFIQRKYFEEFLKVLPVEKVAKIYKAEEDFRIKLIRDLRKGGGMNQFDR